MAERILTSFEIDNDDFSKAMDENVERMIRFAQAVERVNALKELKEHGIEIRMDQSE